GPIRVALSGALLMFAVGGLRTAKRARQIVRGGERRHGAVDASRQPRRNFLQQPSVAVWLAKRDVGAIAGVVGGGPTETAAHAAELEPSACRRVVERPAYVGAAGGEFVVRGRNVGHGQVEALG